MATFRLCLGQRLTESKTWPHLLLEDGLHGAQVAPHALLFSKFDQVLDVDTTERVDLGSVRADQRVEEQLDDGYVGELALHGVEGVGERRLALSDVALGVIAQGCGHVLASLVQEAGQGSTSIVHDAVDEGVAVAVLCSACGDVDATVGKADL